MIMVMGDIHANWVRFNWLVNQVRPKIILQTGDFGYWPSIDKYALSGIKLPRGVKVYWADGNHEDHWRLNELKHNIDGVAEVEHNIFHVNRGSVINIEGYSVMFMGGAESIDKHLRTTGYSWFPEESISNSDLDKALSYNSKVDILVSHTAPGFVVDEMGVRFWERDKSGSEIALEQVLEKFRPSLWFYGHFHVRGSKVIDGCRFNCLNMIDYCDECWIKLE